jgi:hypothetical protein
VRRRGLPALHGPGELAIGVLQLRVEGALAGRQVAQQIEDLDLQGGGDPLELGELGRGRFARLALLPQRRPQVVADRALGHSGLLRQRWLAGDTALAHEVREVVSKHLVDRSSSHAASFCMRRSNGLLVLVAKIC